MSDNSQMLIIPCCIQSDKLTIIWPFGKVQVYSEVRQQTAAAAAAIKRQKTDKC